MIVVVMGVCGCGKTTVGRLLASRLDASFIEGDELHPADNKTKMAAGIPLEDEDREPWLDAIAAAAVKLSSGTSCVVVTCSALKRQYRDRLRRADQKIILVHLTGSKPLLQSRMNERRGHFMPAAMLDSQLATLQVPEPDELAVSLDIAEQPESIVDHALAFVNLHPPSRSDSKKQKEKPMSSKPSVGFIGVGLMGHGMAKNILEAGYKLTVMGHKNRKPVTDLVKRGAKEAKTAAALAKASDVIFICVSSSVQVEELVRGKTGIASGAAKGTIVVDTSTSDPTSTLALAAELKAIGVKLIDAPLGRTPKEAEEGRLNTFVGSDAKTLKQVRPVIETWAENIIHVGPLGNGHKIKLINNFIAMSYSAVWAEAYTACTKTGVDQQTLYDVVKAGGMYCGNFENMSKWVIGRDPKAHEFAIRNCLKDQRYFNNMIEASGMAAIVAPAVKQSYAMAVAKGDGERHMPMMSDVIGELNGITFEK